VASLRQGDMPKYKINFSERRLAISLLKAGLKCLGLNTVIHHDELLNPD
jgi:hypothetical protein